MLSCVELLASRKIAKQSTVNYQLSGRMKPLSNANFNLHVWTQVLPVQSRIKDILGKETKI